MHNEDAVQSPARDIPRHVFMHLRSSVRESKKPAGPILARKAPDSCTDFISLAAQVLCLYGIDGVEGFKNIIGTVLGASDCPDSRHHL